MSSTEPPSRSAQRAQPQDTKSAREALSSKGKVEKVREVDPDEEARKQKFMQYYKGVDEEANTDERPSPYDIYSNAASPQQSDKPLSSPPPTFKDVEENSIPSPSYTAPPDVRNAPITSAGEDAVTEGALPQSDDFWENVDFPDQPRPAANFQETTGRAEEVLPRESQSKEGSLSDHRKRTNEIKEREKVVRHHQGKVEAKQETHERIEKKKQEPSPFGLPGKSPQSEKTKERTGEKRKLPSPFEQESIATPSTKQQSERTPFSSRGKEKIAARAKEEEVVAAPQGIGAAPIKTEAGGSGGERREGREERILEIEAPSLPALPASVVPMATTATTQVASYLTPSTVSLFYQMVGTIYVMSGPQGISRTEILLNNPTFANSKFYGSTITIEKYATAPDSFNIRLTGSHEAVASFKDHIPGLLSAFENGNFNFRVGRIDVEYTLEKPLFRRKEKGEEKGESGGGDLGERSNK